MEAHAGLTRLELVCCITRTTLTDPARLDTCEHVSSVANFDALKIWVEKHRTCPVCTARPRGARAVSRNDALRNAVAEAVGTSRVSSVWVLHQNNSNEPIVVSLEREDLCGVAATMDSGQQCDRQRPIIIDGSEDEDCDADEKENEAAATGAGEPGAAGTVSEAGGMLLHLSAKSSTGYKGVYRSSSSINPFIAMGSSGSLGNYATAVEAATAYAKYVAADEAAEGRGGLLTVGSSSDVVEATRPQRSEGAVVVFDEDDGEDLPLHHSSQGSTGYKGVSFDSNNKRNPYGVFAHIPSVGIQRLGSFGTALEAAKFYARWLKKKYGIVAGQDGVVSGVRGSGGGGSSSAGVGSANACRDSAPGSMTVADTEAQAEREHLTLETARNATGFAGVCAPAHRTDTDRPFLVSAQKGGRQRSLGYFATVEEAALVYARHMEAERKKAAAAAARNEAEEHEARQAAQATSAQATSARATSRGGTADAHGPSARPRVESAGRRGRGIDGTSMGSAISARAVRAAAREVAATVREAVQTTSAEGASGAPAARKRARITANASNRRPANSSKARRTSSSHSPESSHSETLSDSAATRVRNLTQMAAQGSLRAASLHSQRAFHCKGLELHPGTSVDQGVVQSSYRLLSRSVHPDKHAQLAPRGISGYEMGIAFQQLRASKDDLLNLLRQHGTFAAPGLDPGPPVSTSESTAPDQARTATMRHWPVGSYVVDPREQAMGGIDFGLIVSADDEGGCRILWCLEADGLRVRGVSIDGYPYHRNDNLLAKLRVIAARVVPSAVRSRLEQHRPQLHDRPPQLRDGMPQEPRRVTRRGTCMP